MKIFLDANVIVSVLNKEYPLFPYSSRVMSLASSSKFEVFTSPVCLAIAFYFAEKKCGPREAKRKIEILSRHLSVTDADRHTVLSALKDKSVLDFEDGLEYYSALRAKCKCIITEDTDDFYFSKVEVLNSQEFLIKYVLK